MNDAEMMIILAKYEMDQNVQQANDDLEEMWEDWNDGI